MTVLAMMGPGGFASSPDLFPDEICHESLQSLGSILSKLRLHDGGAYTEQVREPDIRRPRVPSRVREPAKQPEPPKR